ncbi:DNA repair-scaffolding protein isoform X3 [Homo sapiens]|uniref:DNA repair-scaffolding protein isoform X3 n=1 Tax=Homo sapiens TaxID=9606 RepID=UPI0007DC79B2|nr:DNA repair-scaffolding protein isoform X3 [Homo sapiens]XP_054216179.1 DNA repair-scaffolding protein isoform X3 [Homo sapiens]|eukprot:XP_016868759.1 DNA repair-scaffolding protein isoform X3 [Homo sapiens]
MPRGSRARGSKRKRSWNTECPSFPGERPLQVRRAGLRTAGAAASLSEAWLRCGEGFQNTSGNPSLTAEEKTITEKHLELCPRPKQETTTSKSTSGLTDITWSSSGSDLSDEDKTLSQLQRVCLIEGDYPSSFFDEPSSIEILEYSSDSEKEDDLENVLLIDSESPHKYHVQFASDARQIMERLIDPRTKSTETILHTPQKPTAKFPRTPENSAKKKLLRGGLAERLNGLQNRERSAISLWRHQCISYQKTLSGRKSGVLTVKILELHEECAMQVAMCEQLLGSPATSSSQSVAPRPGAGLKVLFTKETAGYLRGRPQDTVRIFPPWQKLIIPSGSCPVILNTYFCEKVVAKEDSEKTCEVYCPDIPLPRRSISLAQMFVIKGLTNNSPEIQVVCSGVATTGTAWTHGHKEAKQRIPTSTPLRDSLLDVVESQGAASWPGAGVRVVVQRVYSLPSRDSTRGQQGASSGHTDPAGTRACLLVQDACGMFGEVHLEFTMSKARQLEGKSCSLVGMKVLQKVTRGRTAGIFSLIDTLWPPAIPLKTPGRDQPCEEIKTHLPPPALCYILTAHPNLGQIDIIDEDPIYKLYQPPVTRCLRDILQMNDLGTRCSFYATVIYQKPQLKSLLLLEQREIWLLVTDVTLQTKEERDPRLPKTLLVYVAPLCVLGSEVLEALAGAAPHSLFFKDALRDQGRIVCAERTVLLLQKPLLSVVSGASSCELPGPVMLDSLDSATPVNSICSVQGTVVGVDESTAFSWPVCDMCGNGRLEQRPEDRGAFSCGDCSRVVTSPVLKRHLQVFLDCRSRPQCRVKVKVGARPEHARTPSSLQHSEELRSEECPRKGSGVVKLFCPVRNRPPDQLHWIGGNRASECRRGLCRTLAVAAGSVNFAMWLQGWWWWW